MTTGFVTAMRISAAAEAAEDTDWAVIWILQGEKKMKTAIPLDENKKDICIVLARAPYFLFRENGTDTIEENPAADAQSGAGLQVAQFLADSGIDTLITVRCGENAAEVFKAAGIKIYKAAEKGAAENLTALEEGRLKELTEFHGGFHGGV